MPRGQTNERGRGHGGGRRPFHNRRYKAEQNKDNKNLTREESNVDSLSAEGATSSSRGHIRGHNRSRGHRPYNRGYYRRHNQVDHYKENDPSKKQSDLENLDSRDQNEGLRRGRGSHRHHTHGGQNKENNQSKVQSDVENLDSSDPNTRDQSGGLERNRGHIRPYSRVYIFFL